MKPSLNKFLALVLAFVLIFPTGAYAKSITTPGKSAALMEVSSGRLLFGKNEHEKLPMASTTKIMTCILALEMGRQEEIVTVSKNAAGVEGSSMYLAHGEKLPLIELLYGLMLSSGNDAAVAIAEHIAGDVKSFAELMNRKAAVLGAENTHFVTPNGLHDDAHYTTAYDLALISCYAMKNETFRKIVNTQSHHIPAGEQNREHWLKNKNRILSEYDGGCGIKTGFTKKAGRCLSAAAERNGMQLVAVVLNDGDMFGSCKMLLDYGFQNYSMQTLVRKGENFGNISVENGLSDEVSIAAAESIILPLTEEEVNIIERKLYAAEYLTAPVKKAFPAGQIEFFLNGELLAKTALITENEVSENTFLYHFFQIIRKHIAA
ncbi:MAG: D-alanyl-D-alanine carboxypeptidase [Clostridiales bacterium]|nr:D-alanyl-D-alanine carboxypeptidase [Clostridiales bacterium]